MMRNDYRRALIMLRPSADGYSGHVRLERRTLAGTMYASVSTPDAGGELCAALIRRAPDGAYFASRMGALRRDGRGQAVLAYSFDPRNIDGHSLEEYWLVVIVRSTAERCEIVLSGNVNGSHEVNWNSVRAAACNACGSAPQADQRPQPQTGEQIPADDIRPEPEPETVRPVEPDRVEQAEDVPEEPCGCGQAQEAIEEPMTGEMTRGAQETAEQASAGEMLGVDLSIPWPQAAEPLRALFASQPVQEPMLMDGYTYVRAPMPDGSGYPYMLAGVAAEDGIPVSVSYALPARYTPEPPPGLEEYLWQGGASQGWWTIQVDARTGEKID